MKTDRERLIELLDMNCGYVTEMKAEEIVDYLISKGVTIPVRCGECKHWRAIGYDSLIGECLKPLGVYPAAYDDSIYTKSTDFCSCGERKEE